jgi:hypothetical protein
MTSGDGNSRDAGGSNKELNILEKFVESARSVSNSHHCAALHAFVRQGTDEIAQALVAFPDSNIRPVDEPGQLFNPTMQEVFLNKTGRDLDIDFGG